MKIISRVGNVTQLGRTCIAQARIWIQSLGWTTQREERGLIQDANIWTVVPISLCRKGKHIIHCSQQ